MNDPEFDRAEAIHEIAVILASAYLRLRFPGLAFPQLDSPQTESVHGTAG
jgi:hypothetical protein